MILVNKSHIKKMKNEKKLEIYSIYPNDSDVEKSSCSNYVKPEKTFDTEDFL